MKTISLNPQYAIRNEVYCSYIIKISHQLDNRIDNAVRSVIIIPQIIGYILSNIGNNEFEKSVKFISEKTQIKKEILKKFVTQLVNNKTFLSLEFNEINIEFPPFLLIDNAIEKSSLKIFNKNNKFINNKYVLRRPSVPLGINFMVTTKCKTNCIYCYANRHKSDDLTTEEVLEFIEQANEIGVINLTLTGGDIFAHPDWKKLLKKICQFNYNPFISTKVPLKRNDVIFLKEIGIRKIQFSLDSVDKKILDKTIRGGNNYLDNVKLFLQMLNEFDIKVDIRTVITKYNSNKEELEKLFVFLQSLNNVSQWVLTPAFISQFIENYKDYRATDEQIINVVKITKKFIANFPILYNKMNSKTSSIEPFKTKEDFIRRNQICFADTFFLSVLSNGAVTFCEMLYENQNFLLGNIKEQSLSEIWNSEKALKLFDYGQENIKKRKNNPCFTCDLYADCKQKLGKRICYVDVVKIYGNNFFELPDPRCPQALEYDKLLLV